MPRTSRPIPRPRGITRSCAADLVGRSRRRRSTTSRTFAFGEYLTALAKGNRATAAERKATRAESSRGCTGLSADYVERANLRIDPGRFRKELLRDTPARRSAASTAASRRRRRATPPASRRRVRSVEHRRCRVAYTGALQDYVEERAEVGDRPALPDVGQRATVELGRVPERLHGHDRAAAVGDVAQPVPQDPRRTSATTTWRR